MNGCLIFNVNGIVMDRLGGAHRIASHLRVQGWDCEVIDFFNNWTMDELMELCYSRIDSNTKFIGFSYIFSLDAQRPEIIKFTAWLKQTYPTILIISGSQTTLVDNPNVDYHVTGYGELALDTILKYKFGNGEPPTYDILKRYKTKVINALHNYPAYPWTDPYIMYEDRDFIHHNEWGKIEFSRGCKFKCAYCSYPVLGVKGDYTRDAESARKQMQESFDRFGITNWVVSDETFNDRTEKITKFADMVETLSFNPYFSGYIRADLLVSRPQDREELLRMRFLGHFYGIETFNHKSAKSIKKGMHPAKLQEGMIEIKKFFKQHVGMKYRGHMAFIIGLPHETVETVEQTIKWLRINWVDQAASANPLQIGTNDDYRSSEMSLDYKRFGYREMPDAEFPEFIFNKPEPTEKTLVLDNDFLRKTETMNKGIVWENDYMNVFEASKLVEKMQHVYIIGKHSMERLDPFLMSSILCDDNGEPLSLDRKLKLMAHSSTSAYRSYNMFVENYKIKKINYKK
jgi:radical SAM superfamily enzyme YgiQ (UPF0313 family)